MSKSCKEESHLEPPKTFKALLVTGSRHGLDLTKEEQDYMMMKLFAGRKFLIQGGAEGVDREFCLYAQKHKISVLTLPAQWRKHGKKAGPLRNKAMVEIAVNLRDCGWDILCCAFPGPCSAGTMDCVRQLRAADFVPCINKWGK